MAGRWSDENIVATLNRMGLPTGQGKTWTAHRVSSIRRVRGIHAYRSADKNGEWRTLSEAAKACYVSAHRIRRLIALGVLPAEQAVPGAPYQIRAVDLPGRAGRHGDATQSHPCQSSPENQIPMFPEA